MFNKNIIIYSNIIAVIVGGLGSYFISKNSFSPSKNTPSSAVMASANSDTYHQARVNDHPFIKPLLYAEQESESPHYNDLKNDIHDIIVDFESQHKITSASIYFRDLSKAEWIENNPQYSYSMGSLGKLPLLFTYLHQAEVQPELLNKKVFSGKQPKDLLVDRSIAKNMIEEDHTYTVRQLLEAMTANEDNYATYLLNLNADTNLYRKTYTELGIGSPDMKNPDFEISSKNYSRFLLVLYNASYLSYAMSDYASSLLRAHEFKYGFESVMPKGQKMIGTHEEWIDPLTGMNQLHESAIIYLNETPFLITFMSEGVNKDFSRELLAKVSKAVVTHVQQKSKPAV